VQKRLLLSKPLLVIGVAFIVALLSGSAYAKPAAGAAAAKSPVVIYVTAPVNSQVASYPAYFYGAQAYAKRVNSTGGVGGHPIKIDTCDNEFDPNVMATCARDAVNAHAVAMIGQGPINQSFLTILQQGSIPWVPADPLTPLEYNSKDTFISSLGFIYLSTSEVALAVYNRCASAAVVVGAVEEEVGQGVVQELTNQGIKANLVEFPETATDFSSYVSQASSSSCLVLLGLSDPEQSSIGVALAQASTKFKHIISSNSLTTKFAAQEPSVWNGAWIGNTLTNYQGPTWNGYRAAMRKYFPADITSPEAQQVWPLANLVGNAAAVVANRGGSITAKKLQSTLNANRTWSTGGVIPNLNFTKSVGVTGSPRLVFPYAAFQVVRKGAVVGAFNNQYVSIRQLLLGKKVAPGTFGK
jgi:ABC-type branched-subunit amino acid transport system substrate-binding protein